jgi:uncharacterized damage-inducible protein DinB
MPRSKLFFSFAAMKEILLQYSAYNLWANQLIIDLVSSLPEALHTSETSASFPTLHQTILHLWDAESTWWQRLKLQERIIIQSENFTGNTVDAGQQLLALDRQWHGWMEKTQEHVLQHVFQYQNSKREHFKQPTYQMLLHLFNHGTYHRGQLVCQLRQLGVTKIPATDFIVWSRKKMGT